MMFLPRRTAFVYDLEEQEGNTDVPTTLRRSKEDCPPVSLLFILLCTDDKSGPMQLSAHSVAVHE